MESLSRYLKVLVGNVVDEGPLPYEVRGCERLFSSWRKTVVFRKKFLPRLALRKKTCRLQNIR